MFTPEVFVPLAMSEQIGQTKWMDDRSNKGAGAAWVIGRLKPAQIADLIEAATTQEQDVLAYIQTILAH